MPRCTLMTKTLAVLTLALCLTAPLYAHHGKKGESATLQVTTSSPKARELYEKGMADYENLYLERCNEDWRAAVKEDPTLAVAWAWIAFNSGNPQEVSAARAKARELASKVTPGEQLMVSWISKVQEGDFLGGITAMGMTCSEFYPKDKHLLYLAANWLMGEKNDAATRHSTFFKRQSPSTRTFPLRSTIWPMWKPATASLIRHSRPWTATSPCCPKSPTRTIPTENCSAWRATSRVRSNTIAPRSRLIPTS